MTTTVLGYPLTTETRALLSQGLALLLMEGGCTRDAREKINALLAVLADDGVELVVSVDAVH